MHDVYISCQLFLIVFRWRDWSRPVSLCCQPHRSKLPPLSCSPSASCSPSTFWGIAGMPVSSWLGNNCLLLWGPVIFVSSVIGWLVGWLHEEWLKVKGLKPQVCLHGFTLRNKLALGARLPYAVPGCSRFLGRSEHTCGTRAQQEDSMGFEPTTSQHLRVWRCRLYHWATSYSYYTIKNMKFWGSWFLHFHLLLNFAKKHYFWLL